MSQNFCPTSAGRPIPVTTVSRVKSLATVLGVDAGRIAAAQTATLDNRGRADAFVLFCGPDGSVTVGGGFRVPAGAQISLDKANALHVAVIGMGPTQIVIHLG